LDHLLDFTIARPQPQAHLAIQGGGADGQPAGSFGQEEGGAAPLMQPSSAVGLVEGGQHEQAGEEEGGELGLRGEDVGVDLCDDLAIARQALQPRRIDGKRSPVVVLLRQFFSAMLHRYDYMTIPFMSETGNVGVYVFQILDVERKNIIARPFLGLGRSAGPRRLIHFQLATLVDLGQERCRHPGHHLA